VSAREDELADLKARVPLADVVDLPMKKGMALCPFHGDRNPSLRVYADHYHCFGCGERGDHFDWLAKQGGLTFSQAVERMRELAHTPRRPVPTEISDPAKNRGPALKLWSEARPIAGTIAERYLISRGIPRGTGLPTDALRFHPSCLFKEEDRWVRRRALVALVRNVMTNEPSAVHRIALAADGSSKLYRVALAPIGGGAIKLWGDDDVIAARRLVVGEGLETVLAGATLTHRGALLRPAWSMINSGNLARLPVLPTIGSLTVLADNDENGEGQRAAAECARRWRAAGREVIVLIPDSTDTDFNDVVRGCAP
jgi:hypothetical protein